MVRLADLEKECATLDGRRERLDKLLSELVTQMVTVSDAMSHTYFTHALSSRHLLVLGQETLL